jgi:hypothetical protein
MAYDINADSYPDYDEWGSDEYWKLPDWQKFYDELIKKYGADEGSRRWLDAWWRQGVGAHPLNNENSIKEWAEARGLWKGTTPFISGMYKPNDFIAPSIQNQGQVVNNQAVGVQPTQEELESAKQEQSAKSIKHWLIGGGVVLVGLTIVYFVLRAKNKQQ